MSQPSHYDILGVSQSATKSDLKKAYRDLVKRFHPDLNPSIDAKEKIRLINEAYEVLSENYSRSFYDMTISGGSSYEEPMETEEEKYRREYLRKKAHEERVNLENLLRAKIKFYKFQRTVCYFFFASGILFTIDYYLSPFVTSHQIASIDVRFKQAEVNVGSETMMTDIGLFEEYQRTGVDEVEVSSSIVFNIPSKVNLRDSPNSYLVFGTLHGFKNMFSILVLFFSAIVINNRGYNDFRLTCGIVPGFLVPFMFLMAIFGG